MVFGYRKEIWYLLDENKIHNFFLLRFFIHWYSSAVCAARFLWQTKWETNNEMRLRWRRAREREREMAAAVAAGYVRTSCNKENGVIGRKFTDFHFVLSPTLSVDVVYWVRCIWCNGWRRLVVCTHTHTQLCPNVWNAFRPFLAYSTHLHCTQRTLSSGNILRNDRGACCVPYTHHYTVLVKL